MGQGLTMAMLVITRLGIFLINPSSCNTPTKRFISNSYPETMANTLHETLHMLGPMRVLNMLGYVRGMGKGKLPKKILRKVIDLLQAVYFSIFLVIAMTEFDDQILVDEYLVGFMMII
jgi:hypothetical protein